MEGIPAHKGIRKAACRSAALVFTFALMVVMLLSSFEIAMYADFGVYEKEYEKYDVLSDLDMSMDNAMYVTHEMMDYLRGDRETLSAVTDVDGKRQDFFNWQDRFHMAEVRELFTGGMNIRTGACAAMAVSILLLIIMKADIKRLLPRAYLITLIVWGVFAAVVGAAALIDFNALFVIFHDVFFDNDLWIFDPEEDYMIRMLPEGLFADMVLRIGAIFAAGMLLFSAVSSAMLIAERKRKKQENEKISSEV